MLNGIGNPARFAPKGAGSKKNRDVRDRATHARALLQALDALPNPKIEELPGVYLDVQSRLGEVMVTSGLNASDLTLLKFKSGVPEENEPAQATVFASTKGLEKLQKKIVGFETKDRQKSDGTVGRPYNADLAQSRKSRVRELWRSPENRFPEEDGPVSWELWLNRQSADQFIEAAPLLGVVIGADRLDFPEDGSCDEQ